MDAVEHIVSLYSVSWYSWAMLLLAGCAVLSEVFQPGVMTATTAVVFSRSERMYKQTPDNFPGQLTATLFRFGTIALMLVLVVKDRFGTALEGLMLYGIAVGLLMAVAVTKMLCNQIVDYTFGLKYRAMGVTLHYANIVTMLCLGLYPVLLVLPLIGNITMSRWVAVGFAGLFIGLITYRLAQIYMTGAKAIVYILIYVLTLEVLPWSLPVAVMLKMMN